MSITKLENLFTDIANGIRYAKNLTNYPIMTYDMEDLIRGMTGYDPYEMADIYNTGCSDSSLLEVVNSNFSLTSNKGNKTIPFKIESTYNTIRLWGIDFSDLTEPIEFLFENKDFTSLSNPLIKFLDMNRNPSQDVTFHFKNCKMLSINYSKQDAESFFSHFKFIFDNCEATKISIDGAGEAILNHCKILSTNSDACNLQTNATLDTCYIQANSDSSGTSEHVDAFQFWGHNSKKLVSLAFKNCRLVNPKLYDNVSTNSAMMIHLERSSLKELIFHNVSLAGGGYTCYVAPENTLYVEKTICINMRLGCYYMYGGLYPSQNWHTTDALRWDYTAQDKLIIGSVFEDNGNIKVCVTNDTNQAHTIKTVLSTGVTNTFSIPKCITYSEKTASTTLADFPWNILEDAGSAANATWIEVYDTTSGSDVLISRRNLVAQSEPITPEPEPSETLIFSADELVCAGGADPGIGYGTDVTFKGYGTYRFEFDFEITDYTSGSTNYKLMNRVNNASFNFTKPWVVGHTGHIDDTYTRASSANLTTPPFRCRCDTGSFEVTITNVKIYEVNDVE